MNTLRLALVQHDLVDADADTNRDQLAASLDTLTSPVDLVILPEMFTSAFDAEARAVAEAWPGPTLDWMQAQASRLNAAVTGSLAVTENGQRFNRLVFMQPDGQYALYDKRHLFRMLGEHKRYAGGESRVVVEWRGWRIYPLVCYDLRFPVWCRNTPELSYDLMLFVANWPIARTAHWTALLKARAIENLAMVAGVNRTGRDGRGLEYDGLSAVYGPDVSTLVEAGSDPGISQCTLDRDWLERFREEFPAQLDADRFQLHTS